MTTGVPLQPPSRLVCGDTTLGSLKKITTLDLALSTAMDSVARRERQISMKSLLSGTAQNTGVEYLLSQQTKGPPFSCALEEIWMMMSFLLHWLLCFVVVKEHKAFLLDKN
jgi:hypothetical protein